MNSRVNHRSALILRLADNLVQVSVVNMVSHTRHLVGFMRTSELCDCGCGGHCSIHGMLQVAAWQLEALTG
eukprot:4268835-Pyramimonas_sp.AAC.1